MTCPNENCMQQTLRPPMSTEAQEVGDIPTTDYDVTWEAYQRCTSCGTVFAYGKLDILPLVLIAGRFNETHNGPVWTSN